jgi:Do/DeqQ family serine protease
MSVRRAVLAVLLLACGFSAGMVLTGRMRAADEALAQAPAPAQAPAAQAAATTGPVAASGLPDFSRIAERTVPAVVNVSSQQVVRRSNSPFANDPFLQYFFGDAGGDFGSRRSVENSLGSGVIVGSDGYILTNNHVVTGESRRQISLRDIDITVALADKREMPAVVVGTDPGTDLALLKVKAGNLPAMTWGDSSRLKVAEWVLAIGNPYQLSETVTLGIVSAVGRSNAGLSTYTDFVQTDAAINPGNSGGALVNARGELVGINTAIFSQSGGYQGIGFAVPSNLARRVVADLQQYGEVRRGTIVGILQVIPLTTQLAAELEAPDTRGVVVAQLRRNSPAARAGVAPGDVIVGFNGADVADLTQLLRLVADARIGSTGTLSVLRQGKRVELKVPIDSATAAQ